MFCVFCVLFLLSFHVISPLGFLYWFSLVFHWFHYYYLNLFALHWLGVFFIQFYLVTFFPAFCSHWQSVRACVRVVRRFRFRFMQKKSRFFLFFSTFAKPTPKAWTLAKLIPILIFHFTLRGGGVLDFSFPSFLSFSPPFFLSFFLFFLSYSRQACRAFRLDSETWYIHFQISILLLILLIY